MAGSSLPGPMRFEPSVRDPRPGPCASIFELAGIIGNVDTNNSPKSQESDDSARGYAKYLVRRFARRLGAPAFLYIDRQRVAEGLLARVDNPGMIDQAASSLCGPATLLLDVAGRDPIQYVLFVIHLFERGVGNIGQLEVEPDIDLREYPLPPGTVHEADWVPLASIRDSENWLFDYDETNDRFSAITLPHELATWFEKAGYSEVINETNLLFHNDEENARRAADLYKQRYRVCLFINASLLYAHEHNQQSGTANHWVVLTSPLTLSKMETHCTVYSWGEGYRNVPEGGGSMTMESFLEHYHGFVACRF